MKYLEDLPDNRKFTRTLLRDLIVMFFLSMFTALGVVVTLYFSVKYGW